MEIELLPVADLVPYANNPRRHGPEQVDLIARSIREFGWTVPVLVDASGIVVAGHGRLMAARQLGIAEVPVVRLEHLTPEQAAAYRIADNRFVELGVWDDDLLSAELAELRKAEFDLELTGFDLRELDRLLPGDDEAGDPDDAPKAPAEPKTRPGDLYVLGDHRLICGDCQDAGVVARLLAGARPNLMITDPPYGVGYDPSWRDTFEYSPGRARGQVVADDRHDWAEAYGLFPGDVAYVWMNSLVLGEAKVDLAACGFDARSLIVWNKSAIAPSRGHYHWKHEPCWYAVRRGASAHWRGDRKQSTVWDIEKQRHNETGHATQKPVECMERPIRNHDGDVYDPFVGSGTTLIAAERQGRRCYAVEIDPVYCDVVVARWEAYTGETAVLEEAGPDESDLAPAAPDRDRPLGVN